MKIFKSTKLLKDPFTKSRKMSLFQLLNGMKVVKLYAWEEPFEERINHLRKEEIRLLKKVCMASRLIDIFNATGPFLVRVFQISVAYVYFLGSDGLIHMFHPSVRRQCADSVDRVRVSDSLQSAQTTNANIRTTHQHFRAGTIYFSPSFYVILHLEKISYFIINSQAH